MVASGLIKAALVAGLAISADALAFKKPNLNEIIRPYKREALQDIVTWDEHSLFVHGERVLFYSGEFHPFRYVNMSLPTSIYKNTRFMLTLLPRLPVPSLWLDVFQKIKALGYNGVSFYTDWALLEGKQGEFSAEGIFALEPFFEAAQTAGIYLLAVSLIDSS